MKYIYKKKEKYFSQNSIILLFIINELLISHKIMSYSSKKFYLESTNFSSFKSDKYAFTNNSIENNILLKKNDSNFTSINNTNLNFILNNKIPVLEFSKKNRKQLIVNINEKTINPDLFDFIPKDNFIKVIPLISQFQKNKFKNMQCSRK